MSSRPVEFQASTLNDVDAQRRFVSILWIFIFSAIMLSGCGGGMKTDTTARGKSTVGNASSATTAQSQPGREGDTATSPKAAAKFEAVELGGEAAGSGTSATPVSEKQQMESVVAAMQPLQVMLGKWRGTTNKEFKGFKAVEEVEWVWDFRTDRGQPALTVKSDKGPYIKEGRLTYLPSKGEFQFSATTPEGKQHVLKGQFTSEPEEFTGDDNKVQKKYKLSLKEAESEQEEPWQVDFDQQENNRYLVKVFKKRGSGSFQLIDTIGTQRMGTSVAANDEDYGERKCIISGGLGTMTVSYNGKSYYVCCTGCQAAFNDDPKRWLAKMEEADKAKKTP